MTIINYGNVLALADATTGRPVAVTTLGIPTTSQTVAQLTSSNITTEDWVYVTASDISSFPLLYVAGSEGMVKTVTSYKTGATTGEQTLITTFQYADTVNPTQFTKRAETLGTVA
jgi:hypothetical protein